MPAAIWLLLQLNFPISLFPYLPTSPISSFPYPLMQLLQIPKIINDEQHSYGIINCCLS
jgi:hypothetical protein